MSQNYVCDTAEIIGATVPTTSHHLQVLKKNKLINSRKEGSFMYYFIEDTPAYERIIQLIKIEEDV